MPASEFRALAPADVLELVEAVEDRERRMDYRIGVLTSVAANLMRSKEQDAAKPEDFFPNLGSSSSGLPSADQLAAKISLAFGSTGGGQMGT